MSHVIDVLDFPLKKYDNKHICKYIYWPFKLWKCKIPKVVISDGLDLFQQLYINIQEIIGADKAECRKVFYDLGFSDELCVSIEASDELSEIGINEKNENIAEIKKENAETQSVTIYLFQDVYSGDLLPDLSIGKIPYNNTISTDEDGESFIFDFRNYNDIIVDYNERPDHVYINKLIDKIMNDNRANSIYDNREYNLYDIEYLTDTAKIYYLRVPYCTAVEDPEYPYAESPISKNENDDQREYNNLANDWMDRLVRYVSGLDTDYGNELKLLTELFHQDAVTKLSKNSLLGKDNDNELFREFPVIALNPVFSELKHLLNKQEYYEEHIVKYHEDDFTSLFINSNKMLECLFSIIVSMYNDDEKECLLNKIQKNNLRYQLKEIATELGINDVEKLNSIQYGNLRRCIRGKESYAKSNLATIILSAYFFANKIKYRELFEDYSSILSDVYFVVDARNHYAAHFNVNKISVEDELKMVKKTITLTKMIIRKVMYYCITN